MPHVRLRREPFCCVFKAQNVPELKQSSAPKYYKHEYFAEVVAFIQPIPTHENIFAVGKSGPNATFNLIFVGLGWPRVGEFVGFIIIFICFPTQCNSANRKHPNTKKDGLRFT